MRPIICFDGTRMRLKAQDLDGNGVIGGTESVEMAGAKRRDLPNIQQKSEVGEVVDVLNKDEIENETGMTSYDKMANLHSLQIVGITIWDYLVHDGFLSTDMLHLTRQTKRLSPSKDGLGRTQVVEMMGRSQDRKGGVGFADRMKGFFGGPQT